MAETLNEIVAQLNHLGDMFWRSASAMFVQSSVLIAVVFAIDFLIRRRVRAVVRYCLWMLVLVKLVLPTTLSLPTGIGSWFADLRPAPPAMTEYAAIPAATIVVSPSSPAEPIPPIESPGRHAPGLAASADTLSESPAAPAAAQTPTMAPHPIARLTWQGGVFLAWFCGVTVLTGMLWGHTRRVRGLIGKAEPADPQMRTVLDVCRARVGLRHLPVEMRIGADLVSPAVCGLFRPTVLIPGYLTDSLGSEQLRAVLVHELAHVKRGDLIVNLIQTLLQIVYFYNPLIWLANRTIRRIREQAVDEMTLVALDKHASDYSHTLLDLAASARFRPALSLRLIGVVESKKALSQRIRHILGRPVPRTAKLGTAGLAAVIAAAVVLLPMARAEKDKSVRDETVNHTGTTDATTPATVDKEAFVPRGVLSGRVTGTDGKPATDAKLRLDGPDSYSAETDKQGRYEFTEIKEAGEYRISLLSKEYVGIDMRQWERMPRVRLQPDSQTVKHFQLERACRVKVQVANAAGKPLKKVFLTVTSLAEERGRHIGDDERTDEDGIALIGGLETSHAPYLITARKDGFAPSKVTVTLDDPQKVASARITMRKGVQVKGRAICSDGKPAVGWDIGAKPDWWHCLYGSKGALIDEDGYFTLEHIVPGDYTIHVGIPHGRGGGSISFLVSHARLPLDEGLLEVKIPRPSPASMVSISGRVKFIGGEPSRGVRITALSETHESYDDHLDGDEREFKIGPLPPGTYELRCVSTEFKEVRVKGVQAPAEGLEVEVEYTGKPRLKGIVVDAASGKPVTKFRGRVRKLRTLSGPNYVEDDRWQSFESPEGAVEIETTGPGLFQLQVAAEGFAWTVSREINTDQDKDPIRIELIKGVPLSGQVVDEQGQPVSGAKVIPLSKASGTMPRVLASFVTEDGAVETVDGKFTLEHITPGSETLKVTHPDYCFAIVKDIDVKKGAGTKDVRITLTCGGTVQGHVFDVNGEPEANVTLYFQDKSGYGGSRDREAGRFATAVTNKDGYYEVHHLPEQLCYVHRANEWEGLGVVRHAIMPKNGKTSQLNFGGESRINGRLTVNGKPLTKARILLSGDSPSFGTFKSYAMTGEDGTFTFLGTPPGQRTLYYAIPGRRNDWSEVKTFGVTEADTDLGTVDCSTARISLTIEPNSEDIVAGMRVMLQEYDPKWIRSKQVGGLSPRLKPTDPFVIENVPPGKYELVTYKEGYFGVRKVIEMKPGEKEKSVVLRIPQGTASLSGTIDKSVCGPGGCNALKMWVKDKTWMTYIIPDEQGKYKVVHVPAGEYLITSYDVRDADVLCQLTFKEGEAKTLDLDKASCPVPDRSTGILVVKILTDEGIPLPGAEVYLVGKDGRLDRWSESYGGLTFVGKGSQYELHATYPGYSSVTRKVALKSIGGGGVTEEEISVLIELQKQH